VQEPMAVPVRRLSGSISIYFISIHLSAAENRKKLPKASILGFKIIQGHRCWYH